MNKIISKEHFSEKVFKLVIEAPLIAKSRKAGHFVIVRVGEKGERMPLTIAGADPVKGTEAFRPVQSDSQTSEWYSYFENDVLAIIVMSFIALCHRGKHPVNSRIDYHIKLFIISLRHKTCCILIRDQFNKFTKVFFIFTFTDRIKYNSK